MKARFNLLRAFCLSASMICILAFSGCSFFLEEVSDVPEASDASQASIDSQEEHSSPADEETKPAPTEALQKKGTRRNPYTKGETATFDGMNSLFNTYRAEITLTDVVRGDAAAQLVKAGNRFNNEPEAGKEYILVKFKIKALESKDDEKIDINNSSFEFVSKSGVKYEDFVVVSGVKPELTEMYAGAEMEGYTYDLIDEGDDPLIVFLEWENNGIWFSVQ